MSRCAIEGCLHCQTAVVAERQELYNPRSGKTPDYDSILAVRPEDGSEVGISLSRSRIPSGVKVGTTIVIHGRGPDLLAVTVEENSTILQ